MLCDGHKLCHSRASSLLLCLCSLRRTLLACSRWRVVPGSRAGSAGCRRRHRGAVVEAERCHIYCRAARRCCVAAAAVSSPPQRRAGAPSAASGQGPGRCEACVWHWARRVDASVLGPEARARGGIPLDGQRILRTPCRRTLRCATRVCVLCAAVRRGGARSDGRVCARVRGWRSLARRSHASHAAARVPSFAPPVSAAQALPPVSRCVYASRRWARAWPPWKATFGHAATDVAVCARQRCTGVLLATSEALPALFGCVHARLPRARPCDARGARRCCAHSKARIMCASRLPCACVQQRCCRASIAA